MTSHDRHDDRMREDLEAVDAALVRGQATAHDADRRAMQAVALALRAAAPRPSDAFVQRLEWRVRAKIATDPTLVTPARNAESARIRVLVAHLHPVRRGALVANLVRDPVIDVVGEASDEAGMLARVRLHGPSVVLVDAGLRGGNEMKAVQRLRAEVPAVRALVLTEEERPDVVRDAIAAGASGCVSPRASADELLDAVLTASAGRLLLTREQRRALVAAARERAVGRQSDPRDETAHVGPPLPARLKRLWRPLLDRWLAVHGERAR